MLLMCFKTYGVYSLMYFYGNIYVVILFYFYSFMVVAHDLKT